jgi:hypothetical protein
MEKEGVNGRYRREEESDRRTRVVDNAAEGGTVCVKSAEVSSASTRRARGEEERTDLADEHVPRRDLAVPLRRRKWALARFSRRRRRRGGLTGRASCLRSDRCSAPASCSQRPVRRKSAQPIFSFPISLPPTHLKYNIRNRFSRPNPPRHKLSNDVQPKGRIGDSGDDSHGDEEDDGHQNGEEETPHGKLEGVGCDEEHSGAEHGEEDGEVVGGRDCWIGAFEHYARGEEGEVSSARATGSERAGEKVESEETHSQHEYPQRRLYSGTPS